MPGHCWNLKSNYMLAFAVCKYARKPDSWLLITNDLSRHVITSPENCQTQFQQLCEQYGKQCQQQSGESFYYYVFSMIRRLYYEDLCERMTESQDLLIVIYDFLCLFKSGCITSSDIQEILIDIRQSAVEQQNDNERQKKLKMLERLKRHMSQKMPPATTFETNSLHSIELLPPPLFLFGTTFTTASDDQLPAVHVHQESKVTAVVASESLETVPSTINNSNTDDEIEIVSDDENDRMATLDSSMQQETAVLIENNFETSHTPINSHSESREICQEPMETNESSNISPITDEISNSNDRDLYDHASNASMSNQSTIDTGLSINEPVSSNINGPPTSSSAQLNTSIGSSSDRLNSDSNPVVSMPNSSPIEVEPTRVTPTLIPIEDDEAARMDAEQIPEPVPADLADVIVPNDNAVFAVEELIDNKDHPPILSADAEKENSLLDTKVHNFERSTEKIEHRSTPSRTKRKSSTRESTSINNSMSNHFRRSANTMLTSLRNAKYGSDFSKPLKSFKLHEDYYHRIKKPLDIPEIRQRINNGDYDNNLLLFERDILLMLTNALCMYHRDDDIHGHAQEMIAYAIELFTSLDSASVPWKTISDGITTRNDRNTMSKLYSNNGHDSETQRINRPLGVRTSSITSTSSSTRIDSSMKISSTKSTLPGSAKKRRRKTAQ